MLRYTEIGGIQHGPRREPFGLEGVKHDAKGARFLDEAPHVFEHHGAHSGLAGDAQEVGHEISEIVESKPSPRL